MDIKIVAMVLMKLKIAGLEHVLMIGFDVIIQGSAYPIFGFVMVCIIKLLFKNEKFSIKMI